MFMGSESFFQEVVVKEVVVVVEPPRRRFLRGVGPVSPTHTGKDGLWQPANRPRACAPSMLARSSTEHNRCRASEYSSPQTGMIASPAHQNARTWPSASGKGGIKLAALNPWEELRSLRKSPHQEFSPSTTSTRVPSWGAILSRLHPAPPKHADFEFMGPVLPSMPAQGIPWEGTLGSPRDPMVPPVTFRTACPIRPVTQGTFASATMVESELQAGRQLWRGEMLDPEIEEFRKGKSEFAHYRSECSRETARASRARAQQWRMKKLASATLASNGVCNHFIEEAANSDAPLKSATSTSTSPLRQKLRKNRGMMDEPQGQDCDSLLPFEASERLVCESLFPEESLVTLPPTSRLPHIDTSEQNSLQPCSDTDAVACVTEGPGVSLHARRKTQGLSARKTQGHLSRENTDVTALLKEGPDASQLAPRKSKMTALRSKRAVNSLKENLRNRQTSEVEDFVEKSGDWDKLKDAEKEALIQSFSRYDVEQGSGTLDEHNTMLALCDLGFKGRTSAERDEIMQVVHEQISIFGDITFFNYWYILVPLARQKLHDVLKKSFEELADKVWHMDAELERQTCLELIECFLADALTGPEEVLELREAFQVSYQELRIQYPHAKVFAHEKSKVDDDSQFLGRRRGAINVNDDTAKKDLKSVLDVVTYREFGLLMEMTHERQGRLQSEYRFKIIAELSPELQERLGGLETDILPLHSSFRHFDEDKSGTLCAVELNYLLQEFGFLTGKVTEDAIIRDTMSAAAFVHKGSLTFVQFLQVMCNVRELAIEFRSEETSTQFLQFDRDHNGELSVQEVAALFEEMGLAPKCRQEQDEISHLLHLCDGNHNGVLDLEEFQHLVQVVSEKLRSITRFREKELGLSLKFTEQQVRGFRDFFWEVDSDGSGQLDLDELRIVMQRMKQDIAASDLRVLMDKLDRNNNSRIDFSEFLRLVHVMEQLRSGREEEYVQTEDGRRKTIKRLATSVLAAALARGDEEIRQHWE